MKKIAMILCLALVLAGLPGCASDPPAQIAATTLPVYEFTRELCAGTPLTVTRLVTEQVSCLHDYSLNVRQVKAAEAAEKIVSRYGVFAKGYALDIRDEQRVIDIFNDIDSLDRFVETVVLNSADMGFGTDPAKGMDFFTVPVEDFQRDVLTWLHIVEDRYHVKPIIYTYYKFKEKYLNAPVFDDYPYWIAHYYVDKVEYKGAWKFWQHTDVGRLPGIKSYVDFNIYNGSFYDMKKLTIGNQDTVW